MRRHSSKLSFWVLRPSQAKEKIHIELPLLSRSARDKTYTEYAHQIQSLSIDYRSKEKLSLFDRFLRWYGERTSGLRLMIHPESLVLLYWNMLIFFTIFVNFIEIPIVLLLANDSYYEIYQNELYSIFYYLIIALFVYDMVMVRPRISYDINGRNITGNEEMLRHYLTKYFLMDFLGILVLIISFLPISHIDYLRFVFFLKIEPMREINREIRFKLLVKRYASAIYDFFKLTFLIMFVSNFFACIYFAIDFYFYMDKGQYYEMGFLWLNGSYFLYNIDVEQSFGRVGSYIYALYWSMETAGGCGYGIATPKNPQEILYVNFVMLVIEVVFVYFTDGIINLIIAHGEGRRRKLGSIKKVVNVSLQLEIERATTNKFVEYIADLKNTDDEELEQYMEACLSSVLKNQFNLSFKSHFLNLIDLIALVTDNSPDQALLKVDVANIIRRKHYQKGDFIYRAREPQGQKLLIIERGVCVVENGELGYRRFESEWGVIGKREFYFQKMPIYTICAEEYVAGLEIDRAEFLQCLKAYRGIYERYRELMDTVYQNGKTEQLHVKCIFCNKFHLHEHCPMVNDWRLHLRIHDPAIPLLPTSTAHPRAPHPRPALRSRKFHSLSRPSFPSDSVLRGREYFPHYNI